MAAAKSRKLELDGDGEDIFAKGNQVYTIPTYDAAFKWVLTSDEVRNSFFHAFLPDLGIQSSERIDEHMHPVQALQLLRNFLQDPVTCATAKRLSSLDARASVVQHPSDGNGSPVEDENGTAFLRQIVQRFQDIKASFPEPRYEGKMDFACRLSSGGYALVEMQVITEDHWDRRALAYVASFYGNQLSKGADWKQIRKVVGVNILGGGSQNKVAWPDAPDQFMRHYKFEDQLNGKGRFIDGIELFQYSIMNAPTVDDQGMKDWITFFRRAHFMNEEEVAAEIKTPAVLRAFELAKISKLPAQVRASYQADDEDFDRYSQHTAEQISKATKTAKMDGKLEGKHEGKLEVAQMMMKIGRPLNEIQEYTGLSSAEMEVIKSMGS
jgi:predicted transposase/invertase (TIGR01784 family)